MKRLFWLLLALALPIYGQQYGPLTTQAVNPASPRTFSLLSYGWPLQLDYNSGALLVEETSAAGSVNATFGGTFPAAGQAGALQSFSGSTTVPFLADSNGRLLVYENADPSLQWGATSGTTPLATNTSTAVKAAGAAGIRNYVTNFQFYNTSSTVSTTISILDGATIIWTGYIPATTSSVSIATADLRTPLRGTAATAMNIQCGTTGASVYYNVQGFQAK